MTAKPITAATITAASIHAAPILAPVDAPPRKKPLTVGVFDSGFGGLTVLRALLPLLPDARFIYLGDTARLPYGSKSRETIARYAVSSGHFLEEQGAELLVVACNTATALALSDLERELPIPVLGVVAPGAAAAKASNPAASVLVLATAATVQSEAYIQALHTLGLTAHQMACPLLVPLVEEGWIDHPVTDEVLRIYLEQALNAAPTADTLLLGCTHYPLLEPAIHRSLAKIGHPLTVIDSATATARATARLIASQFASVPSPIISGHEPNQRVTPSNCAFYATDSVEKFQRLGSHFLGRPLDEVRLIDLGG